MARTHDESWNDLVSRGVDLGAGLLRLYGETVRDLAGRKVSYTDFSERATRVARDEGAAYARSLTRAAIDYWAQVLEVGYDVRDSVVGGPTTRATREPGPARLDFTGAAGEEIARAFVVENSQPQAVDVSFEVSKFAPAGKGKPRKFGLAIEPDAFTLAPGQEHVVTCRLTLPKDLAPGQTHEATLRVIGFPDMIIALTATVA